MASERSERGAATEPWVIVRFIMVGIGSTLAYVGISFLLIRFSLIAPGVINIIGLSVSIWTSYLGHYYFTYRRAGRHIRFGSRFFAVTIFLFLFSTALTFAAVDRFGVSPYVNSIAVAVLYPVLSFVLHHFWTFIAE
jgi:putative flippase GtrA